MGFRYQLCTPDGDVFGEVSYAYTPDVGDEIIVPPGTTNEPERHRPHMEKFAATSEFSRNSLRM